MASEHDARTRAFYDHESDEPAPARRRRAAADWGVNEDIFDRMPSRRFTRADRRAEHRDDPGPRFERRVAGPARPSAADRAAPRAGEWAEEEPRHDDWSDAHERRQVAPRRGDWADTVEPRRAAEWADEAARREDRARAADWADEAPRRQDRARVAVRADEAPRRGQAPNRRSARRPAESWTAGDEGNVEIEGKRPIQSWLEPERGESRTIVLERSEPGLIEPVVEDSFPADEFVPRDPLGRKTVTITGHPDRLPVARTTRPPRTAIERIGASPDRIAGYAVLLGFVLILIAVLTTGQ